MYKFAPLKKFVNGSILTQTITNESVRIWGVSMSTSSAFVFVTLLDKDDNTIFTTILSAAIPQLTMDIPFIADNGLKVTFSSQDAGHSTTIFYSQDGG